MKKTGAPIEQKTDPEVSGKPMITLDDPQSFVEAISQLMSAKKTGGIPAAKIADRISQMKKVLGDDWEPGSEKGNKNK